ncbi:MAG: asparaginase [Gammaproteobacteria bacterium]|nr:asparaginase [Gammaproteobacteria bacterium]
MNAFVPQLPREIQLFITGGTLDKDYDAVSGELVFPPSHLDSLLAQARCTLPIELDVLMQKDSLHMDDADRAVINQACQDSRHSHIVITHGTDTMVQSAQVLLNNPNLKDKTIVFTGAMRPFKLGESDASFNVGTALMAVQLAKPGVYLCMNGRLFAADQVQKNRVAGLFEAL